MGKFVHIEIKISELGGVLFWNSLSEPDGICVSCIGSSKCVVGSLIIFDQNNYRAWIFLDLPNCVNVDERMKEFL